MSNNNSNNNQNNDDKPKTCNHCWQFYGTKATDFLCSVCYQKSKGPAKEEENESDGSWEDEPQVIIVPIYNIGGRMVIGEPMIKQNSIESPAKPALPEEPKPVIKASATNCEKCSRKLGNFPFECKCGSSFCKFHRLPEEHDCKHDFKNEGKAKLAVENPKVVGEKVSKI